MENKTQAICNHCGGKLTMNGDILSCLMCGREADHLCANCLIKPEQNAAPKEKKKKASAKKSAPAKKAAKKAKPVKKKKR